MESLKGSKIGHWMDIISTLFVLFTNDWLDNTFEMDDLCIEVVKFIPYINVLKMHNGWTIQEWKTMLKKLFIPLFMAYKDFLMIMITLKTFYNHLIEGIYISWHLFCLNKYHVKNGLYCVFNLVA
jgi:hypothetical protein